MNRARHALLRLLLTTLLLLLSGCTTPRVYVAEPYRDAPPAPAEAPVYQVFLVGNTGELALTPGDPLLRLLDRQLDAAGAESAVVFLGDNLGPAGLADTTAATGLHALLATTAGHPGRVVFVPGGREWQPVGEDGITALARLERYVETYGDGNAVFVPDDGFPGPAAIDLADDIMLVALDTEWWLRDGPRPTGDAGAFDIGGDEDFLFELETLVRDEHDKRLLVVGHHPIRSYGAYGGRFPWRAHFTPLPVLGSLRPLYRRFIGGPRDLANERYVALRRGLGRAFGAHESLIYASGHEQNMQYFRVGKNRVFHHYLVAGAGAQAGYAGRGGEAAFTARVRGFMRLRYYADGAVWLDALSPETDAPDHVLFSTRLQPPRPEPIPTITPDPDDGLDFADSTVVTAANPGYERDSRLVRWLVGSHNRKLWAMPVEAPVFDAGRVEGGLRPVQAGGRGQSTSIRFLDRGGRSYVLRSVDKTTARAWPAQLRGTLAQTLTQDQVSILHPYGALAIPPLAEAAGVFHTSPRLYFVPADPRLGAFGAYLEGQLAIFELRPDEDMSDVDRLGNSENIVSSRSMLLEVTDDNDHRVDPYAFARARLLDMMLGDWDRHDDQWRWATYEPYELDPTLEGEARTQGKIYLPIPRDRDAAFMRMNGLLPSLARHVYLRKYRNFEPDYEDLRLLNENGRPLDRRFTSALRREDWIALADSIRHSVTDEIVEEAFRRWPEPIFAAEGEQAIATLKARRDRLPEAAERYYLLLAGVSDVVGSNKHERFEVTRLDDDRTEVVVYKTTSEGDIRREHFRRVYFTDETDEIRLYGLGGEDRFIVTGQVRRGPRVIAVGGRGEDVFTDSAAVAGPLRRTWFVDTPDRSRWTAGRDTRLILDDDPLVGRYDMGSFHFDTRWVIPHVGYNVDDGLILGAGVEWTQHAFLKQPFARRHWLQGHVGVLSQALFLNYEATFSNALGPLDLDLNLLLLSPENRRNFYGLGNDTPDDAAPDDRSFYRTRFARYGGAVAMENQTTEGFRFRLGPTLSLTRLRNDPDRFLDTPSGDVPGRAFANQVHLGLEGLAEITTVDRASNPHQGFRWTGYAFLRRDLSDTPEIATYAALETHVALYLSPSLGHQFTLAPRLGAGRLLGTFPFYDARTIGGAETVRGFRSHRFAGRSRAFANLDVRLGLFDFANYLAVGTFGLLGFVDTGRVWVDGDRSTTWHTGAGGGLWVDLFEAAVLTAVYARSAEGQTVTVKLGFQY